MEIPVTTVVIDPGRAKANGLSPGELLLTLACAWGVDVQKTFHIMLKQGMATLDEDEIFVPTRVTYQKMHDTLFSTTEVPKDNMPYTEEELTFMATKMKEAYPPGKKDGQWYWADSVQLIKARITAFAARFGKFPPEKVVQATKQYVEENQYSPYMKLLKYFVFREGEDGLYTSDLLNILENGETGEEQRDWTANVR